MQHPIGRFTRHDLLSHDRAASAAFYQGLFGWKTRSIVVEGAPAEVLIGPGGVIGVLSNAAPGTHFGSHWMPFVATDDIDGICERARAAGGTIIEPPFPVPGHGSFGIVRDPARAYLAMMQYDAPERLPRHPVPPAGSFCWTQLISRAAAQVVPFYRDVFGWQIEPTPDQKAPTWTLLAGGQPVGTITQRPGPAPEGKPDHWLGFIAVDDCAATAAEAQARGATIVVPPTTLPGAGIYAWMVDPVRADFGLWQDLAPPDRSPPDLSAPK